MDTFNEFLEKIENIEHKMKTKEVLDWIIDNFPDLNQRIAWNQPMFTHEGTFILGFSVAKNHLAITPEKYTLDIFSDKIVKAGYEHTLMLFKIKWDQEVNYKLLKEIIEFNITDKEGFKTFWR